MNKICVAFEWLSFGVEHFILRATVVGTAFCHYREV